MKIKILYFNENVYEINTDLIRFKWKNGINGMIEYIKKKKIKIKTRVKEIKRISYISISWKKNNVFI